MEAHQVFSHVKEKKESMKKTAKDLNQVAHPP